MITDEQFKPYPWTLREVVDTNFYEIPIYQRPYTWGSTEVDTLLNDIINAYEAKNNGKEEAYFTGTVFLRKNGKGKDGKKDKYELVDGQQRMTTFTMILISLYSIAINRGLSEQIKDISDLKSYLWKYSSGVYSKDEPLLTLSSIDKEAFKSLIDSAYDDPKTVSKVIKGYKCKCNTEKSMIEMFLKIINRFDAYIQKRSDNDKVDPLLDFLSFVLDRMLFIAIQSSLEMPKVFAVFESINCKAKPLDEIDKIKTYIFSLLDESEYDTYLTKWGQLIIKTEDHLHEYLQTYVKAFISYYRVNINLAYFNALLKYMMKKYALPTLADTAKKLIDDMYNVADNYSLINNEAGFKTYIGKKPKLELFYKIYLINKYYHPRSLIFRAICEEKAGLITKDDLQEIVKSSTLFIFKFQSIYGGDSKDTIAYYESIAKKYYDVSKLDSGDISKHFKDGLVKAGIDKNVLKSSFISMNYYSKHDLAYIILSLCESIDTDNKNKLLYSQAYMMLSHIKDDTFHLDHMLPQTPKADDNNFKYYCTTSSTGEELLVLKEGHDFPEGVISGMKYDEFKERTLHRIGNIRLFYPELNEGKGNGITKLPDHKNFVKYEDIVNRCDELADLLISSPDLN